MMMMMLDSYDAVSRRSDREEYIHSLCLYYVSMDPHSFSLVLVQSTYLVSFLAAASTALNSIALFSLRTAASPLSVVAATEERRLANPETWKATR